MPFRGHQRIPSPFEPVDRPYTVAELNTQVKSLLEREYPDVWVEGAISRPTQAASGHLYFGLQDETARIDGVMWGARARALTFRPVEGIQVRVRGQVTLYPPGGRYQIVVSNMEPAGLGARELLLKKLRERLKAEGLLDPARKRKLPFLPRAIALVTSLTGAAVRDLVRVILRRFPRARLLIVPVKVQGEGAAADIADGIRRANLVDMVDVAIVGRGGGSVEDLWAFNEEPVARALFASRVPVISAVGHAIDTTLSDDVADVRAATPSQAGELVVPLLSDLELALSEAATRTAGAVRSLVRQRMSELSGLERRAGLRLFPRRLDEERQRLDEADLAFRTALRRLIERASERLAASLRVLEAHRPSARLLAARASIGSAYDRLLLAIRPHVAAAGAALESQERALSALNPTSVLGRGFSLTWIESGGIRRLVRSSEEAPVGAILRTTLAHGDALESRVIGHVPN